MYCNLNYFWLPLSIWSSVKEYFTLYFFLAVVIICFISWLLLMLKNAHMLACSVLDIDSVESGDHYFWRMRAGWVCACALGTGPSKWSRTSTARGEANVLGCGCDSKGDRCRWGLHPRAVRSGWVRTWSKETLSFIES